MSSDTHVPAPSAGTIRPTYPIGEELRRYDKHLRDLQGLSPGVAPRASPPAQC